MGMVFTGERRVVINWECLNCGYRVSLPPHYAGRTVKCPQCGSKGDVDASQTEPETKEDAFYEPTELARCPFCRELIRGDALKCKHCGEILDRRLKQKRMYEAAIYEQATQREREGNRYAKNGLICAIVGLFCFGVVLGPVALVLGFKGLDYAKKYPKVGGEGAAIASIVLGVFAIIGHIVWLYLAFGRGYRLW